MGEAQLEIAVVLMPGFTALDAIGPYEVLHRLPNARLRFVGHVAGPVTADSGLLTLHVSDELAALPRPPHVILVPGGTLAYVQALSSDTVLLDWLRQMHEHTLYTTSVCSGSLVLGAAGLLNGLEATTHWMAYELLASLGAKPVPRRVVREGRIITAAGVSAGIDMALELAMLLRGEETAKTLQLFIEYDPQPPYDVGSVAKAGKELVDRAYLFS